MRAHRNDTRGSRRTPLRRALPLVLVLFGCDDFLATEPKAQLTTSNFFTTEAQALQATNAAYAMLRNWQTHTLFWVGMTDIVSDDATKGSHPNDAGYLIEFTSLTFESGNLVFRETWMGYYQGIYRANVAIENIPQVAMDEARRARLVGENKFLRAYYYFFLARAYGGVPLITEPLRPGDFYQQRATQDAVFAQIEQDLQDAIAVLPERSGYSAADEGRATRGAARALLAQAHMFQEEYAEALTQAQAVIGSGEYSLYPDYAELFSPMGENSSESVFEVQTIAVEGGNTSPSGGASQYAQVQGVRGTPNIGWGFNTPSPDLEESYEPGDPRLQATILYPWEMVPDGSGIVVRREPTMPNPRFNSKVYTPANNPGGPGNSGVNIRRIRYADVLLLGAEAAFRTGNEGQARTWLNMVRERARSGMDVTLGLHPEELSDTLVTGVLGLGTSSRVGVRFVDEATQAYAAGVRSFTDVRDNTITPLPVRVTNLDIITEVEGTPITDLDSYLGRVDDFPPAATVTLDLLRVSHPAEGSPTTETLSVDVPVLALLPDVTAGGQALLDAIWAERRHELAMEQHRWFDLIRQGRAGAVMEALTCEDRSLPAGCPALVFQEGKHELYPVPLAEVTVAELAQNPGY
ncbi:MAG TPA: RagB/SusD family nutrient uptake outer membrane protein [Longimicrobiales bacterium]|nr:RagB/SusD family nutrient uptake outer membrane protein [Longimicrobiales bacterium]